MVVTQKPPKGDRLARLEATLDAIGLVREVGDIKEDDG